MAFKVKGWKKQGKGEDTSYARKGYGGIIFIGKNDKGWYFEHGKRDYFKTKAEAQSNLKKYMEKYK